jgi:hypothetical protein
MLERLARKRSVVVLIKVNPTDPAQIHRACYSCVYAKTSHAISHTIQWGRDLFDGMFVRRPKASIPTL